MDLLFLKRIFVGLKNKISFCALCFTCHSLESFMNMQMRCLNDPQLVKVSLGWHQTLISGRFWGGQGGTTHLGFVLPLSELCVPEDCLQLKNIIPSHGVKW